MALNSCGDGAPCCVPQVLQKRAQIIGSTLRARSKAQKCEIVQQFWDFAEPHFKSSAFHPKLDQTYKLPQVRVCAHLAGSEVCPARSICHAAVQVNDAVGRMQDKKNTGKIIMVVD